MQREGQSTLELERRVFHLQTMYEVANALNNCRDRAYIYREVLSILMGTFGVEYGLGLTASGQDDWKVMVERGFDREIHLELDRKLLAANFGSKKPTTKASLLQNFVSQKDGRD
ncbi:hypothetical protein MJD09_20800, partial [bacterium]|nr:hypothetical protein [bacterium]